MINVSVSVLLFFFFFLTTSAIKRVLTFYILYDIVQRSKDASMHEQASYMPSRHRLESLPRCPESYMPRHQ